MIDEKRIADFFAELVSIDSPSLEECEMADTLKAKFAEIGVNFTEDHTQEQTGSNAGNLFARIPGSIDGAPVLFAAHMDTVEPAKGKKAVFHDDGTVTSDGTTVLGADDLAGVTAIYEAVRHITEAGAPHSPIEILISTGEELYCKGANAFDYSQVQAKEAYVLDLSGAIGAAAYAAPTLVSFKAEIQGKAAHAGFHPEDGINSIQAAARAVAQLPQGHVAESTTANIGKIGGGSGTNIVSESCLVEGEIRSLNHETAMELLAGTIQVSPEVFAAVRDHTAKKGDVLGVARLAGIMGAKKNAELIPLCHIVPLTNCEVTFTTDENTNSITAVCTTSCVGKTGVEMEALTGVSTALLTIYDMCKAMDRGMVIRDIHILEKDGGKSGHYIYQKEEK